MNRTKMLLTYVIRNRNEHDSNDNETREVLDTQR
jgi:hypothetical protein